MKNIIKNKLLSSGFLLLLAGYSENEENENIKNLAQDQGNKNMKVRLLKRKIRGLTTKGILNNNFFGY